MGSFRRVILSLALAAGLVPAASFAAPPPPVPALPDTQRLTTYSITGTTCACAVNFALYGDSTDYQNWIEVWLNGVRINFNDATFGWTVTSPTGPLGSIPRPVTDAVLTFNSVQTGTVQIVGSRRPRRVSQFNENKGVAARDLNQALTDIIATQRERWDKSNDITGRSILGLPGEVIANLPPAASRASGILCWDATGLIPLSCAPGIGLGNVVGPNSAVNGHIALFSGTTGRILLDGGTPGTGTVTGPVSSTNNGFARWNGTGGLVLEDGPTVIGIANGGSNNALTPSNGGLVYSDAAGLQILSGTATANQIPLSGSNSAPSWSTSTWPATTTANQLLYSSATNTVAGLASLASGALVTDGSGVPSISQTLPAAVQANITTLGAVTSGSWAASPISGSFISANSLSNNSMAQQPSATIKGNPTGSLGNVQDFTIQGLTNKVTPSTTLDFLMLWDNATGTFKSVTPGQLVSSSTAGVSTLNGLSGALSISAGQNVSVAASGSAVTVSSALGGFVNMLRNSSMTAWFHGCVAVSCTITTAGGWCAEGVWVIPTGASVTCQQVTSTGPTFWGMKITGATSVTDLKIRFVQESFTAAQLAGKTATFQLQWINNSGSSITPTIQTKYAGTQDNWSSPSIDLGAVNMQACTNTSTCTEAYTFAANASGNAGYEENIDFGNNFGAGANTLTLLGGFDLRATPGVSTGTNASPPVPEIRNSSSDIEWNQRFYEATYNNGVAFGVATAAGEQDTMGGTNAFLLGAHFAVQKRANPTITIYSPNSGSTGQCYNNAAAGDTAAQVFVSSQGMNGVSIVSNGGTISLGQSIRCHWTADATISGG